MDSGGVVELAALGRPFTLGMLYDLRSDSLITGMTLWNEDTLSRHIRVREQNFNEFEVITSDSLQSKTSSLNVDASLKLSILSNTVRVAGSANYLNASKSSKHQERVTLRFKETNLFKEMSMHHLGKLQYSHVINKGLATHVVTGILYGAQAFFVFDREVSEDKSNQAVHGEDLKLMIKKIPKFALRARGDVKMDTEDQKKVDQFSCTFFGDVCLDKSPTTFMEAIETYKSLPELLKDGEKAVPMTVFMLPLTSLCSSAPKLGNQISVGLVQKVQSVLESFTELEMRCNDVLKTATLQPFSQFGVKLNCFKDLCAELKLEFQQTVAEKLPLIKGGVTEEAELTQVLEETHSFHCNHETLNQWINQKEKEIYTFQLFKEKMKNTIFIQSETQLYKDFLSEDQVQILCFVFTSLGRNDPFLSALSAYLKGTRQDNEGAGIEKKYLDASEMVTQQTIEKVKLFNDFSEGNKETKFLAIGLTDDNYEGSTIYLYENGFLVNRNYELPSKPETVTADDRHHNSVSLKVSPPRTGAENVISYSVEVCVNGTDKWDKKTETKTAEVRVGDLKPDTEYVFRCRGVTSVGYGPPSDPSNPIKTLPFCSSAH